MHLLLPVFANKSAGTGWKNVRNMRKNEIWMNVIGLCLQKKFAVQIVYVHENDERMRKMVKCSTAAVCHCASNVANIFIVAAAEYSIRYFAAARTTSSPLQRRLNRSKAWAQFITPCRRRRRRHTVALWQSSLSSATPSSSPSLWLADVVGALSLKHLDVRSLVPAPSVCNFINH